MSAVSVYPSGIFFLFRGYRKSSIKPSKGLFISKPFERGLNGNGGGGGGGFVRGGEGEGRNRGLWYSQTALIRTLRELNNSLPRKAGGAY